MKAHIAVHFWRGGFAKTGAPTKRAVSIDGKLDGSAQRQQHIWQERLDMDRAGDVIMPLQRQLAAARRALKSLQAILGPATFTGVFISADAAVDANVFAVAKCPSSSAGRKRSS